MDTNNIDSNTQPRVATPVQPPVMSIVLVCWNNKDYLEPCLRSLYDGGLSSSFDVVVTDNGSTDGSQAMLAEKFPHVRIIQNDHNVGLGKASNQGIQATQGRYVLLLNNDTLVNASALDSLVDFLEQNPEAGAVGGKLLNPDGSFQSGYAGFSTLLEEFLIATRLGEFIWKGYPSHGDSDQVRAVGWLSSACLLLRRSALNEVGLLDESYFIYGDEADLQFRLNKAGWKVFYLPDAEIIHYGGRSMDRWRRRKMVYRGKMLFYQKNYGEMSTIGLRLMLGV
ncbi:MAG: glycosyltransferase family 2 protein, partial [Anaerolineales bacterium]